MMGIQGNQALISAPHNHKEATFSFWIVLTAWAIFCLCLTNIFVIVCTLTVPRLKTNLNTYLMALAFADIVLGNICMPITLAHQMGHLNYGIHFCMVVSYVQEVCVAAELFTRAVIAYERCTAIYYPLRSRQWCRTRFHFVLAVVWIFSSMISLPSLWMAEQLEQGDVILCVQKWPSREWEQAINIVQLTVTFIMPFCGTAIACSLIFRKLWQRTHSDIFAMRMNIGTRSGEATCTLERQEPEAGTSGTHGTSLVEPNTSQNQDSDSQIPRRHLSDSTTTSLRSTLGATSIATEKRVFLTLIVIVAEFFVCWLPVHVVNMIYLVHDGDEKSSATNIMLFAVQFLGYASTCFNPFVYFLLNRHVQATLMEQFRNRFF